MILNLEKPCSCLSLSDVFGYVVLMCISFTLNRYLTVREQKLQQRRQQVEELLAWKEKLDEEEARIRRMEKEALQTFQKSQKSKLKTTPPSGSAKGKSSSGEKEVSFIEPSSRKKDGTGKLLFFVMLYNYRY